MSLRIVEPCINCGACEPECPNEAISSGSDLFVIDAERCTECVGAYDSPRCVEACPVDGSIVPDPSRNESHDELLKRYVAMHP